MFFSKPHPKKQFIYAVTGGVYLGELLVYMATSNNNHKFLSLPKMINRDIPVEKFTFGVDQKIVDTVEKLPVNIYKTCMQQFKKNEKEHSNRLLQIK